MDPKILFAAGSLIFSLSGDFFYIKDIFWGHTRPHIYTWLIWVITQGTAAALVLHGGGQWGSVQLIAGTVINISVVIFCIRRGTKNITRADTITFIAALLAIVVWWQMDNPFLAALMIAVIDVVGYLPTYRKTYHEPHSEHVGAWLGFAAANIFAVLALSEYNFLTLSYLVSIFLANMGVVVICLWRRGKKSI